MSILGGAGANAAPLWAMPYEYEDAAHSALRDGCSSVRYCVLLRRGGKADLTSVLLLAVESVVEASCMGACAEQMR